MDKEEFDFMEVKPCNRGWYYVTMFQFEKMLPEHPDYIQDWLNLMEMIGFTVVIKTIVMYVLFIGGE